MFDLQSSPIHLLHRARQRADELLVNEIGETGITPRQFAILHTIGSNPGLSQTAITSQTGSDRSTTADLLTRLERIGLVERTRAPNDARANIIKLTDEGASRLNLTMPGAQSADEQLLSIVSSEERRSFIAALMGILNNLDEK